MAGLGQLAIVPLGAFALRLDFGRVEVARFQGKTMWRSALIAQFCADLGVIGIVSLPQPENFALAAIANRKETAAWLRFRLSPSVATRAIARQLRGRNTLF